MAADLIRAVLLFRDGPEQNFPLPELPEVRVGFDASNEVRLPFEGVSRSHAKILRDEKGYWIEDAGSANGTFLNGQPVTQRRRLDHLDVVRFGRRHRLLFVRKAAPSAPISRREVVAAWLEPLSGAERGERRDIPRGTITIGRSPAANVHVDSHLVSKLHVRVERTAAQLSLVDLRSSNGTFVNDKRVDSQILADGDEINLGGSTRFKVHIEEGDVSSGESKVIPPSSPDTKFPYPSDWKTKIEWSPEDKAAMQRAFQAAPDEGPPPAPSIREPAPPAPPPAAAPAQVVSAVVLPGVVLEGRGRAMTFGAGDHLVGRSPECVLRLDGRSISRRHALMRVDGAGASVRDLGSANGTFVNGRRAVETTPISPGDEVKFGDHSFRVRAVDGPAGDGPPRK
ncbi:MAG TPA: FHA domain-containing protein [Thermoanaerobaculia bacterium]|nr:FHA domain-containing protein [Thermoanaerobaculia bacterium]